MHELPALAHELDAALRYLVVWDGYGITSPLILWNPLPSPANIIRLPVNLTDALQSPKSQKHPKRPKSTTGREPKTTRRLTGSEVGELPQVGDVEDRAREPTVVELEEGLEGERGLGLPAESEARAWLGLHGRLSTSLAANHDFCTGWGDSEMHELIRISHYPPLSNNVSCHAPCKAFMSKIPPMKRRAWMQRQWST